MKAMISQPMAGKTDEEITKTREKATDHLRNSGYEVVNTLDSYGWLHPDDLFKRRIKHGPLYFLTKSLEAMSQCDAVYFCKGWNTARGCRIEHEAARAYGLEIIYEE